MGNLVEFCLERIARSSFTAIFRIPVTCQNIATLDDESLSDAMESGLIEIARLDQAFEALVVLGCNFVVQRNHNRPQRGLQNRDFALVHLVYMSLLDPYPRQTLS